MDIEDSDVAGLRAWAAGSLAVEAAVEILIRAGYADPGAPWMRRDEAGRPWVDFARIPDLVGGLSSGQARLLRLVASIGADTPIILADEISGLDRQHTHLVLAALAHTAGFGSAGMGVRQGPGGLAQIGPVPPLYTFDQADEA